MADMVHAARARTWLDDPGNRVPEDVAASLNASLAISTATREVAGAVITQTQQFATRMHDIASALEPDAGLVRFNEGHLSVYVNPAQVAFVGEVAGDKSRITTGGGAAVIVNSPAEAVAAKLGVSA